MLSRQAGIACTVREQANAESMELWPLVKFLVNVFVWSVAPANVVLCCLILASHIGTYKCRSWRTKQYFYFMSCPLNQQPPWHSTAPGESKARQDWHWLEQCENVDEPVLRGGIRVTHGTKKTPAIVHDSWSGSQNWVPPSQQFWCGELYGLGLTLLRPARFQELHSFKTAALQIAVEEGLRLKERGAKMFPEGT